MKCRYCEQPLMRGGKCIYYYCPSKLPPIKHEYDFLIKEAPSTIEELERVLNYGLFDWEFVQLFKHAGGLSILYRRIKQ